MPNRRHRAATSLAVKTLELSAAVPQVVAHRVTRMALAGATLSDRDRKEFELMVTEKHLAFTDALAAMGLQAMRVNQALATSWFRALSPWTFGSAKVPLSAGLEFHEAMLGVLAHGMAPIHRKAVANARRLARTRLR